MHVIFTCLACPSVSMQNTMALDEFTLNRITYMRVVLEFVRELKHWSELDKNSGRCE
jgi:hypothetical protein